MGANGPDKNLSVRREHVLQIIAAIDNNVNCGCSIRRPKPGYAAPMATTRHISGIEIVIAGIFLACALLSGCSRPQKTNEEVANALAPADLKTGGSHLGGPSGRPVGGGAGGSAAAGEEAGFLGGPVEQPVAPAYPPGRMSPNGTSGSGTGDRGNPIPPDVPIVNYPTVPVPIVNGMPGRPVPVAKGMPGSPSGTVFMTKAVPGGKAAAGLKNR